MEKAPPFHPDPDLKLMDQVRETLALLSLCLSYRTILLSINIAIYPLLRWGGTVTLAIKLPI